MLYCKRIDDSHDRRAVQHSEGISLLINAVRSEYGIMITESDISYGKLGKPYLPEYPRIYFSIAHCSGLAACLVSDKVCGVDAEALRKVSAGAVKRVFSQAEEKLISSAPESDRDIIFTTFWTLKEAYSKADGRGLAAMGEAHFSLNGDNIISDTALYFRRFFLDGYVISVCCSENTDIRLKIV